MQVIARAFGPYILGALSAEEVGSVYDKEAYTWPPAVLRLLDDMAREAPSAR